MKKILFLTYDGLTDPLGQSQVLPYISRLSAQGHKFYVLSFEKPERFQKEEATVSRICAQAGIVWIPLPFHSKPPVLAKVYDRMMMKKKAIRLHKKHGFDMIHCRSYPSAEVGLHLKKNFGLPFLFDMRGFWADEKLDSGHWNQKKPWFRWMYRYYKNLEREFLNQADRIISLTMAGKKELVRNYAAQFRAFGLLNSVYPRLEEKIAVIPTCADLSHFDYHLIREDQQQLLRKQLGIREGQHVLSYSGSLGTWYMMDEMLQFFKAYKRKFPDAVFLCLTKEPKSLMDEYVKKNHIDPSSVITTFSNRAQLPLHLSLSTCSVFFIRPTYSKISSSPTKYAELMGLGIPVVCNDIGDTGKIAGESRSGVLVESFDEKGYQKALSQIDLLADRAQIRSAAFDHFDLDAAVVKYRKVYDQILRPDTQTIKTVYS